MTKDTKRQFAFALLIYLLIGCTSNIQQQNSEDVVATIQSQTEETSWDVYDSDPNHIWNRLFRQLYQRTANGKEYGSNELDALLWSDTTHLLNESVYQQTIDVLDEFLDTNAENLITDSLKRAMFQHDMWAVFDWLTSKENEYPTQSFELQSRLAQVIKRVALSEEEILSLPDNYQQAVESQIFPTHFEADFPQNIYLPDDLFQSDSAWVALGRENGPIAITHISSAPFLGRSVFLVFLPTQNDTTLDFIHSLQIESQPLTPIGTEAVLVRRMLLISDKGELILSPLIEQIQIRYFNPNQTFYEFELNRKYLFNHFAGGLIPKEEFFLLFMGHGDVFENTSSPELKVSIPSICLACHSDFPPAAISGNTQSIISYSRNNFLLPNNEQPILFITNWETEAQVVITWKLNHETWQALKK